ncbi:urease accessory UreF family protein [Gymnodinialimonas sp. 2305UL16-5]|uniref:urease accessory protein UreF n=1 Tax=Gymnodinialimonas mytili TaxID=3126503 RepID=UPI0030B2FB66
MIGARLVPLGLGEAEALLRVSQWLSPAFPTSSYAYSHGLEAEIAKGHVADADGLERWISVVLRAGAGRSDAILVAAAMDEAADLDDLCDIARALAGSAERWEETRDQGAALARTLGEIGEGDGVNRPYPVAFGAAAKWLDLKVDVVLTLYLQAFAASLISAAVRFMPLGQSVGQGVHAALRPVITDVARKASRAGLDGLGQAAFGADLAAMEHEGLEVRIFRT